MAKAGTIIPSNVSFSIGGDEISITDTKVDIELSNNSSYVSCILDTGKKGYLLKKGSGITRSGDLKVQTMRTGDKKGDNAISKLSSTQSLPGKSDDPSDYTKDIAFSFSTSGGKNFLNVTFQGFIEEYKEFDPVGTEPPKQEATIEIYSSDSLKVS